MIETDRCTVRPFEEKDLDAFMSYRNNEEWMQFQNFKNRTKGEYRKALLVPLKIEKGMQLAIAEKATDDLLGDLFLKKAENNLMIGYSIHPSHARKGYVTEVLQALLPKLKEQYSDCEIIAMTDKENIASINLLRKLGFEHDGWDEAWESEVFRWSE